MDLDHVGGAVPVEAPDVLAEHLAGHNLSLEPHQQFQDVELRGREIDGPVIESCPTVGEAQVETSGGERHGRLVSGPAVHGLDPRQQLVHRERLDEIVVGARLEGLQFLADKASRREHDHGGADPASPRRLEHREAVFPRQHEVENHQVAGDQRLLACHGAVRKPPALMAGGRDRRADRLGDDRIVLDDGNLHPAPPQKGDLPPSPPGSF